MWKQLITDLNEVMSYEAMAKELKMSKSSLWDLEHKDNREPMLSTYTAIKALHKRKYPAIKRARGKV